ncbi:MAG: PAS domain S-box protein [Calditrichaeota bacterium]|nr:MAG: PAS domain S-box protein [Calditrichota bacterium]
MKILLLLNSSVNFKLTYPIPDTDFIAFSTFDELPLFIDPTIYNALVFVHKDLDLETRRYVKELIRNGFDQPVYLVGSAISGTFYQQFSEERQVYLYELSSFPQNQIPFLIQRIQNTPKSDTIGISREQLVDPEFWPTVIVDAEGQIVHISPSFVKQFGFDIGFHQRPRLAHILPGHVARQIVSHCVNAANHPYAGTTNIFDPDEKIIPIRFTALPLSDGKIILMIEDRRETVMLKRTAERIMSERAQEHQLFDALVSGSDDPFYNIAEALGNIFATSRIIKVGLLTDSGTRRLGIRVLESYGGFEIIPRPFESFLLDTFRTGEMNTLHFSPENKDDEIGQWARTAILVPISSDPPYMIVILFSTPYEPESHSYDLLRYLQNLLGKEQPSNTSDESIDFYRSFMQNSREGMYKSTAEGELLYANPALLDMLGYGSLEEIKNKSIPDCLYFHPSDRADMLHMLEEKGYVDRLPTILKHKTGRAVYVEESVRYYKENENGRSFLNGIIRDVTEKVDLKNQLDSNRELISELIDQASVMIAGYSATGWLLWNKRMEETLGYEAGDFQDFKHMIHVLSGDHQNAHFYLASMDEYLSGASEEPVEMELTSQNGQVLLINWSAATRTINDQPVTIYFGVDVTQSRLMDRRQRESEMMQLMASMAYRIADVFRFILSDVAGQINQLAGKQDEQQLQTIEWLKQKLLEGNRVAEQLIKLSNFSQQITRIMLKPNQAVEQAIQLLRTSLPETIQIEYTLNAHGQIRMEENLLNQILLNLALNSVAAMREGGTLFVNTDIADGESDPFLRKSTSAGQSYFKLSFRDTGHGMDADTVKKMFEPFFTTSSGKAIKGLGATQIYFIVKGANGFIDVQSAPGQGTTVTLYIPLLTELYKKYPVPRGATPTLMIVDDQMTVRELIKDIFVAEGYKVLEARDGVDGLKKYKEHIDDIDLVIIDIIMPKMNGAELYYELHKLNPGVKALITSGHSNPELNKALIEHGVLGFIPKPPDVNKLKQQVNTLLRAKEKIAK